MRSRVVVGTLLFIAALSVGMFASVGMGAYPAQQRLVANFARPTQIAGAIVMGPVLFVHDEAKMETGEACTRVYRYVPGKGAQEEIVAFICKPTERPIVDTFTATCRRALLNGPDLLTEYQFPGDSEAHGVPISR
jgi:hypothetical protein